MSHSALFWMHVQIFAIIATIGLAVFVLAGLIATRLLPALGRKIARYRAAARTAKRRLPSLDMPGRTRPLVDFGSLLTVSESNRRDLGRRQVSDRG